MTDHGQPTPGDPNRGASLRETARQLQMSVTAVKRWANNGWLESTVTDLGERRFQPTSPASILPGSGDETEAA